jgi:hypothetical protein
VIICSLTFDDPIHVSETDETDFIGDTKYSEAGGGSGKLTTCRPTSATG